MIEELNRRLDAIDGYIDCVNQRAEQNMPSLTPPNPNRLLRRQYIEKQIEESLFSPNIEELHSSIPPNYSSAKFIRQLIENDENDQKAQNSKEFMLDKSEYTSVLASRQSKNTYQNL